MDITRGSVRSVASRLASGSVARDVERPAIATAISAVSAAGGRIFTYDQAYATEATAGTGSAPLTGGVIGFVQDRAGNANMAALGDGQRPTLRYENGVYYADHDNSNDSLWVDISAMTGAANATAVLVVRSNDAGQATSLRTRTGGAIDGYIGFMQGGSSSTGLDLNVGNPTYEIDGVALSPENRGQLSSELSDGVIHKYVIEGFDISADDLIAPAVWDNAGSTAGWDVDIAFFAIFATNASTLSSVEAAADAIVANWNN